jgi:hypothetical protein
MRPTWKAVTMVEPNAALLGSTSVACWLEVLVNVSVLSFVSATGGGGGGGGPWLLPELLPDPQPERIRTNAKADTAAVLAIATLPPPGRLNITVRISLEFGERSAR